MAVTDRFMGKVNLIKIYRSLGRLKEAIKKSLLLFIKDYFL